jgi:MFS family permease
MIAHVFNRLSLAGLCATLVGNGLGRFAFVALMPALIQAGWFTQAGASTLGVATLVGYVFGAAAANRLAARVPSAWLLRAAMVGCGASFVAGAIQGAPMAWHVVWRAAAGACGAILMVLPAQVILPRHEADIRARTSGVVFSGIGLGAALSGLLVPLLIAAFASSRGVSGLAGTWLALGAVCLALAAAAWHAWPAETTIARRAVESVPLPPELRSTVVLLLVAHGLNAVGYLAHTLFLPDYVVRELHMPLSEGGFFWAMFGLGAAVGPMVAGTLADTFGLKRCLMVAFALKALAAILPVWSSSPFALVVSSVVMGLCTPGIVAIVSAYALARVGPLHHGRAWGLATSSFAVAQAAGAALMAFAATRMSSYQGLFCASALALVGSFACIALIRERRAPVDSLAPNCLSPAIVTAHHP